jgi:hypothetical protein
MTMVRTAMGKLIDMNAIIKNNEETIAVSNIPMNARGDRLDTSGRVVVSNKKIAQTQMEIIEPPINVPLSETTNVKKQTRKKKKELKIVSQRSKTDLQGNNFIEIEYEDGSIEIKNDN